MKKKGSALNHSRKAGVWIEGGRISGLRTFFFFFWVSPFLTTLLGNSHDVPLSLSNQTIMFLRVERGVIFFVGNLPKRWASNITPCDIMRHGMRAGKRLGPRPPNGALSLARYASPAGFLLYPPPSHRLLQPRLPPRFCGKENVMGEFKGKTEQPTGCHGTAQS